MFMMSHVDGTHWSPSDRLAPPQRLCRLAPFGSRFLKITASGREVTLGKCTQFLRVIPD